jgi:hypothetical protein
MLTRFLANIPRLFLNIYTQQIGASERGVSLIIFIKADYSTVYMECQRRSGEWQYWPAEVVLYQKSISHATTQRRSKNKRFKITNVY